MATAHTTTSVTIEGQLLELFRELQEQEAAIPEDTRPNRVSLAFDLEGQQATLTATLPITLSGTGNQVAIAAGAYLP